MNNYACGMLLSYGLTCVTLVVIVFCSYVFFLFLFCFQAPNPRLPTPQQPGQLPPDQLEGGTTIPPPVPVVGKLTVKGKFDFTSVSHCLSGCPSVVKC